MPGMSGIDLLRKVRASDKLKGMPVLMVTAEAKRDQIIEAARPASTAMWSSRSPPSAQRKDREDLRTRQRLSHVRGRAMDSSQTSLGEFESTLKKHAQSWSKARTGPFRRGGAADSRAEPDPRPRLYQKSAS